MPLGTPPDSTVPPDPRVDGPGLALKLSRRIEVHAIWGTERHGRKHEIIYRAMKRYCLFPPQIESGVHGYMGLWGTQTPGWRVCEAGGGARAPGAGDD